MNNVQARILLFSVVLWAVCLPGTAWSQGSNAWQTDIWFDASPASPATSVDSACMTEVTGNSIISFNYRVIITSSNKVNVKFFLYFNTDCSGASTLIATLKAQQVEVGTTCTGDQSGATAEAGKYYCLGGLTGLWAKLDENAQIEVYRHGLARAYTAGGDYKDFIPGPAIVQGGNVVSNIARVMESDIGTNTLSLTIHFFEDMDTSINPTIGFPEIDNDANPTLTFASGSWSDVNTYTGTYDVVDADQVLEDINVEISNARYPSGTVQGSWPDYNVFSIDMPPPNIAIEQSVNTFTPVVGDQIVFSLSAKNTGPDDAATNLMVKDALPLWAIYVSDNSSGNYTPANGEWNIGTLSAGSTTTLQIITRVAPTATEPTGSGDFIDIFADDALPSSLVSPTDTAFDANGNLYVSSFGSDEIVRYDANGIFDTVFAVGNDLNEPSALAFGPDGDLFVASAKTSSGERLDQIIRFDGSTGAFVDKTVVTQYSPLEVVRDLAFDADGRLYVSSDNTDSILKYNVKARTFEVLISGDANLASPYGLAFNSTGDLLVSSSGTGKVLGYNPITGASLGTIVDLGAAAQPTHLVIGPENSLFVTDATSGEIKWFDLTSGASKGTFVSTGAGGLSGPAGLTFGSDGQLYIASSNTHQVLRYDGFMLNTAGVLSLTQGDSDLLNDFDSVGLTYQEVDFGDAPDPLSMSAGSYPTLAENNGARHVATGPLLGVIRSTELQAQQNAMADGDDDDGVTFTSSLKGNEMASVDVTVSEPALLDAWIDFDNDGTWEAGEQIFASTSLTAGTNSLTFFVPTSTVGGNSYARFRLSTIGGLDPTGSATDGEVEDYLVVTELATPTLYVDSNATPAGDGLSWNTAFDNLQDALAVAISGQEIWVAGGVYYPDLGMGQVDNDVTSTFNIDNGVKLFGGFNGTEENINLRNPQINITVLSGDIDGNDTVDSNGVATHFDDLLGSNAYHVMTTLLSDDTTVIDGITITGGWAAGANPDDRGSALNCNNSNVTINAVIVQGNISGNRAALWDCDSLISQSSFINNFAGGVGAVTTTPTTFTDTLFMGNKATNQGSVFYMSGGTLNLTRVQFIANVNSSVVRVNGTTLNFNEVLFSGNSTSRGALDLSSSTNGTLNNITMIGNRITLNSGAGIKSTASGNLIINNSIFWNNADSTGIGALKASINHTGTGTITINSSIIQDSATNPLWDTAILIDGGGNLDEDPLFILDTDPSTAPTTIGNAHLDIGSPAIASGDNSVVTSLTDLDGNPRIPDSDVDMGAYAFTSYGVTVNVSGLDTGTLVLQNNGGDDLIFSTNSSDDFGTPVANTAGYSVTVLTQPTQPNQDCIISNASGTINLASVLVSVVCTTIQYNVGVDVSGLANGVTLGLINNAEILDVTSNGITNFATTLTDLSAFAVSVATQPSSPNQMCSITSNNAIGNLSGADVVVTIVCTTIQYTVGVDVLGLANGNSVILDNIGESLTVTADGPFNFATALDDGSAYDVTITTQPQMPNQMCSVVSGAGSLSGADVLLTVTCTTNQYFVGGMATGLAGGNSVTISLDTEDLTVNSNAAFVFINPLTDESQYTVSVLNQPTVPNQTCGLVNPTGTIAGNDITDIEVNCVTNQYRIGGTVTGLHSGNNLVLQNNGADDLIIANSGDFDFATSIEDLQGYNVSIFNQPNNPIQPCVISNNNGNVAGSAVTTVAIVCEYGDDLIYKDGFE